MAYRVTTTTGYGQRIGNSLKGMVVGLILFLVATGGLFWNEGNYVKTGRAIDEAQAVTTPAGDVAKVDPGLNGKVIHATAKADTKDVLTDDLFGVSDVAIAINRKVEYFQHEESSKTKTRDNLGGSETKTTDYEYPTKWVSKPIDSSQFKDPAYQNKNTVLTPVEEKRLYAKNVTFGGYSLPQFLIQKIGGEDPAEVNLGPAQKQQWDNKLGDKSKVHVRSNVVYLGKNPDLPEIGDVRVTLTRIVPAEISLIAKVNGSTFEEFIASNGRTFSAVARGTVSADAMFKQARDTNSMITWIIRGVGALLVVIGLRAMFGLVPTILKVLPFLSSIVGAGIGLICVVGGVAWSLLIIAIAWLTYRPLIGVPLLVLAVAGIVYLRSVSKAKKAAGSARG
ncbi:MAG: TMEM43 family protein [Phycisphaerae bacterium]|nr:TMEM43 family protein [Phycisphaerae bacterium]